MPARPPALSEARLERIQARFDLGEATAADLAGARSRREARAAEQVRARGRRAQALALLRSYLGVPDMTPEAPAEWRRLREAPGQGASPRDLTRAAAAARPVLAATEALVEAEQSDRAALWADILPDLRLSASYLQANPNPNRIPPRDRFDDSWTLGAEIVWSLERALVGSARQKVRSAEATRLEAERRDILRRLGEQIRVALVALESAAAVHRASLARVEAAEERFRAHAAAYRVGRITLDALLDADVELAEAHLEVVSATVDHHLARARLERILTGLDSTVSSRGGGTAAAARRRTRAR